VLGGLQDVISVDALAGDDSTPCCGFDWNGPCRTITHAMSLVIEAHVPSITIQARVLDAGGDWTPPGEQYPIVLSYSVELFAPGVSFFDPLGGHAAIFAIEESSADDSTQPLASIVGTASDPVRIGMSSSGHQSSDPAAIAVAGYHTLNIANAVVNGSASAK
jgi:hypothetical protein